METGPSRPKKEVEGATEKTKFKCDFPNYRSATSRTTNRRNEQNAVNRIADIRQSGFEPVVLLSELLTYLPRGCPPF
jgi:hypothetical protein